MKSTVGKIEPGVVRASDGAVLESKTPIKGGAFSLTWKREDGQPSYQMLRPEVTITLKTA